MDPVDGIEEWYAFFIATRIRPHLVRWLALLKAFRVWGKGKKGQNKS